MSTLTLVEHFQAKPLLRGVLLNLQELAEQTDGRVDRQTDGPTNKQRNRLTGSQTDKWRGGQIDREIIHPP